MIQANVHQAKTQLSKLIERAEAGEEVIIARRGKPAVRLQPVATAPKFRKLGLFNHLAIPLPTQEELAAADREVAALFEESVNAPTPERVVEDVTPEELARLSSLSSEELYEELVIRP